MQAYSVAIYAYFDVERKPAKILVHGEKITNKNTLGIKIVQTYIFIAFGVILLNLCESSEDMVERY